MGCKNRHNSKHAHLDLLDIPALRYVKPPVQTLSDLYVRYPAGGEWGWQALVMDKGCMAYWDVKRKEWRLMCCGYGGSNTDVPGGGNTHPSTTPILRVTPTVITLSHNETSANIVVESNTLWRVE